MTNTHWLESDDIRRNMTDSEILRMKLNLKDSMLDKKEKVSEKCRTIQ